MARGEAKTLEYISVDCVDKTTLKRLYRKFGNDGRLLWYELLRLLGRTENYFLDVSNQWDLEDIIEEELLVEKDVGIAVLNQLCDWGNLDKELWKEHQIIWCQDLINRHISVFKKRKNIPQKPLSIQESGTEKRISATEKNITATETTIKGAESTQSKVKERKEEERKEDREQFFLDKKSAYEFLEKNVTSRVEAFEMQNKKTFKNYNDFVQNFNFKVIEEKLEFDVDVLFARLSRLNINWDKENRSPLLKKVASKLSKHD